MRGLGVGDYTFSPFVLNLIAFWRGEKNNNNLAVICRMPRDLFFFHCQVHGGQLALDIELIPSYSVDGK